MATIVVSGAIANRLLNGGGVWVRLNWVLGLQRLGFEVFLVEQISPESCVDAAGLVTEFENSENLAYFKRVTEPFGLSGKTALVYDGGRKTYGLTFSELEDLASEADLLINISGHLTLEPLTGRFRRKVYLDIDPGFTQFWHDDKNVGFWVGGHDFYYTIGENIGTDGCLIPKGGIDWKPIRPPVVRELWQTAGAASSSAGGGNGENSPFTTIANWRGPFGPIQYDGKTFGLKVHEFRKFIELPKLCRQSFEIALNIYPADIEDLNRLRSNNWGVVAPKEVAPDPLSFRDYVQNSKAEFSVAQGVYVDTYSGWFSDRTVDYLAAGKPALVQDTGFSRNYPAGEGLVAFSTLEEAVAGAERIAQDYEKHCRAARCLAAEYFDSDKVLSKLMEEVAV